MKYNHPITRFPPYNLFFLVSRFWNNQTSIQYFKNKVLLVIAMIELKYDINTYQFHTVLWKIIYTLRLHETYIYIYISYYGDFCFPIKFIEMCHEYSQILTIVFPIQYHKRWKLHAVNFTWHCDKNHFNIQYLTIGIRNKGFHEDFFIC